MNKKEMVNFLCELQTDLSNLGKKEQEDLDIVDIDKDKLVEANDKLREVIEKIEDSSSKKISVR